ncbi:reverse transcriptase domain-containing protein, partial [Tanacetum coccineum]
FGVLKALISDRRKHFCNSLLEKTLKKYRVTHRLATPYHPQTSEQTKNTNRAIKRILERTINGNRKEWADKLDDALWAFRTAYKNLLVVHHSGLFLQLNQLDEFWSDAYKHSQAYKERTKRWHNSKIMDKEFQEGGGVEVLDRNGVRLKNAEAKRQFSRPARPIIIGNLAEISAVTAQPLQLCRNHYRDKELAGRRR